MLTAGAVFCERFCSLFATNDALRFNFVVTNLTQYPLFEQRTDLSSPLVQFKHQDGREVGCYIRRRRSDWPVQYDVRGMIWRDRVT